MGSPRIATAETDEFLRANWERHTVRELAKMMGWPDKSVRDRARILLLTPRREIALAITRKLEADRIARRNAVRARPSTVPAVATDSGWSDGWSIKPPSIAQLRGEALVDV